MQEPPANVIVGRISALGRGAVVPDLPPREYFIDAHHGALQCRAAREHGSIEVWRVGPRLTPLAVMSRTLREWGSGRFRLPHWFAREDDLRVDAAEGRITLRLRGLLSDDLDYLMFQCKTPLEAEALCQLRRRWTGGQVGAP
jgi:hypothetical protein